MNSPLGGEEGPSGIKTTLCPVCEEVIHGNGEELNSHVETCLRKVLTVVYLITCIIMTYKITSLGLAERRPIYCKFEFSL